MIRITLQDRDDVLVMKVEGCLTGAWVSEVEAVFRDVTARRQHRAIRVDMRDVQCVNDRGLELMTDMYLAGAEFETTGCEMPELVREITRGHHAPVAVRRD